MEVIPLSHKFKPVKPVKVSCTLQWINSSNRLRIGETPGQSLHASWHSYPALFTAARWSYWSLSRLMSVANIIYPYKLCFFYYIEIDLQQEKSTRTLKPSVLLIIFTHCSATSCKKRRSLRPVRLCKSSCLTLYAPIFSVVWAPSSVLPETWCPLHTTHDNCYLCTKLLIILHVWTQLSQLQFESFENNNTWFQYHNISSSSPHFHPPPPPPPDRACVARCGLFILNNICIFSPSLTRLSFQCVGLENLSVCQLVGISRKWGR